ncbi:DprA-like winged helix domain-containing protein [Myroides pelagicus]|uniref:DprA-like winged helix domain-containing protein n=1 Tax=Myroides pelagicus TaxID=270914 RepID=UPI001F04AC50|nr:hypothetical protein [Myroides pelagicus]MEC4113634.1 hypothetical protein [Myroides pelagicus]
MSQGCNEVIRTHRAQLLTSARDIITALNWDCEPRKTKQVQPVLFLDLTVEEQQVFDYLIEAKRELLDLIALGTSLPIYKVSTILLNLELKEGVRPLPGKYYEIV